MGLTKPDKVLWQCPWCDRRHLLRMRPGHAPMCTCMPGNTRMLPIIDTVVRCKDFKVRVVDNWGGWLT
jgi:hypothetical protein